jgi:hypothetical protein
MNDNWTRIRKSKQEHHAAPFSMTEEFVSVYRMHPLLPDDYTFRSLPTGQTVAQHTLTSITGRAARNVVEHVGLTNLFTRLAWRIPAQSPCTITRQPYAIWNATAKSKWTWPRLTSCATANAACRATTLSVA